MKKILLPLVCFICLFTTTQAQINITHSVFHPEAIVPIDIDIHSTPKEYFVRDTVFSAFQYSEANGEGKEYGYWKIFIGYQITERCYVPFCNGSVDDESTVLFTNYAKAAKAAPGAFLILQKGGQIIVLSKINTRYLYMDKSPAQIPPNSYIFPVAYDTK